MRKFLLLAILLLALPAPHTYSIHHTPAPTRKVETYVYICDSKTAYAYHSSSDCRGLSNCRHKVIKVTLSDAVNIYHRKPCKICE